MLNHDARGRLHWRPTLILVLSMAALLIVGGGLLVCEFGAPKTLSEFSDLAQALGSFASVLTVAFLAWSIWAQIDAMKISREIHRSDAKLQALVALVQHDQHLLEQMGEWNTALIAKGQKPKYRQEPVRARLRKNVDSLRSLTSQEFGIDTGDSFNEE